MKKLLRAALVLGASLAVVGLTAAYDNSRVNRQIDARPVEPESTALSLPKGEVSAGDRDRERIDSGGSAGGTIWLTGEPAANGVRLSWRFSGLASPEGIKISRSQNPFPSVTNDETVEAPPESGSFLWPTPPGNWHFRLCMPDDTPSAPPEACKHYSNNIQLTVGEPAEETPGIVAVPDQDTADAWANSSTDLNLRLTPHDLGILLEWKSLSGQDFRSYRVVRSESDPQPSWPGSSYLVGINDQGFTKYIDRSARPDTIYHYRVCAERLSGSVTCGNSVTWQP
jgi:hypothetical protein